METKTLYRAAQDDYTFSGMSLAARCEDAEAYLDNPGFGGANLYSMTVAIDPDRVLRLDDMYDLADALIAAGWSDDHRLDIVENLGGTGAYIFEILAHRKGVASALARSYDWVVFADNYPVGCETWWALVEPTAELILVG